MAVTTINMLNNIYEQSPSLVNRVEVVDGQKFKKPSKWDTKFDQPISLIDCNNVPKYSYLCTYEWNKIYL